MVCFDNGTYVGKNMISLVPVLIVVNYNYCHENIIASKNCVQRYITTNQSLKLRKLNCNLEDAPPKS